MHASAFLASQAAFHTSPSQPPNYPPFPLPLLRRLPPHLRVKLGAAAEMAETFVFLLKQQIT